MIDKIVIQLKKNDPLLWELNLLDDNQINDAGAKELAIALKHNTVLRTLNIKNNKILWRS